MFFPSLTTTYEANENHEAAFKIRRITYVCSNGECIKPVEICSVSRNNAESSTGQQSTKSILYSSPRNDLLVGLLLSRLDLPFVFLVGPSELGARDISLNTIMIK